MRNVQKSTARGAEWAGADAIRKSTRRNGTSNAGVCSTCKTGGIITTACCAVSAVAVGRTGFCCGNKHDFIVAQQSQLLLRVVRIGLAHAVAGAAKGTDRSVITSKTAMISRLVITTSIA
ncbi:MAG: hypothetical protein M3Y86_07070 [Verrucomicrobiota bacterium]|nr:hypothetical protein [Verrucomicrobiota bacterium]